MPRFKNGVTLNYHRSLSDVSDEVNEYKRLRISAGRHRFKYVDVLVLEAKLGRKLLPGMTVEHKNGDTLDLIGDGEIPGDNLIEVTASENTKLMFSRRSKRKNGKKNKSNDAKSNDKNDMEEESGRTPF